ncbi:MAG TPA: aspartate aminotransferase family protein [Saprospiraceae bacterium]|nr:aspartate aminotransferase family protein [Saprospiraceae bacterium]
MFSSKKSSFLRHVAQTSLTPEGFEVSRADGIYLYDQEGKPFIDCNSGIAVSSFGHNHPVIRKAILDQLDLHLHTMVYGEHVQQSQVRLAEKLAHLLPAGLDCTYFVNSGAEAVEGAMKLARKFTGRYEIMACRNAYHGSTLGAESLRSDFMHTAGARPLVPGIRHIDFNSLEDLDKISKNTAAVILEPIQGEAGVILPEKNYLSAVLNRCKEVGALMILDEIQTGMGRTGSMFAFEKENVKPDILLLAKAFGGGLPLGAFIASQEIMKALSHDPPLGHMTTFGGHPLSCAASLAAFEVLEKDKLAEKVNALGNIFKEKLSDHSAVKEIRGRGLMLAIELNDPAQLHPTVQRCKENGLLLDWFLFNDRSIRFYPPLIISEQDAIQIIDKLIQSL